jgi:DNA ligase 1
MIRPLLGCDVDLSKIRYPVWASPKIDGIRGINRVGTLWSRKAIALPNRRMQQDLGHALLSDMDGELVHGKPNQPDTYQRSYSAVMSEDTTLPVDFYVFDLIDQGSAPFELRFEVLRQRVLLAQKVLAPDRVILVEQRIIHNEEELLAYEIDCVEYGFEGVMLRDPTRPYKYGRSTMVGQELMKLKRFVDGEAEIIGFDEQLRNENAPIKDAQGLTKRSTHKAGKVPTGRLGKFLVRDCKTGVKFKLSGRISNKQREEWWAVREQLLGKIVIYKHFVVTGVVNKPRLPIFKWFRDPMDF